MLGYTRLDIIRLAAFVLVFGPELTVSAELAWLGIRLALWTTWYPVGLCIWLIDGVLQSLFPKWGVAGTTLRETPLTSLVDNSGQVVNETPHEGVGAGPNRHAQLSSFLVKGRLRSRARWVRRLEYVLGGAPGVVSRVVRGRWTPDLPSASRSGGLNIVLAHVKGGVRILGGGSVAQGKGEDKSEFVYWIVETSDGRQELVFPALLSKLASYALARERDALLVSALRARAQDWCKKNSFSEELTWLALPSALRLAWDVSPGESALVDSLRASGPGPSLWWARA